MKIIKKNIEYKGEKYRAVIKRNYFQTNYYAVIVKLYKQNNIFLFYKCSIGGNIKDMDYMDAIREAFSKCEREKKSYYDLQEWNGVIDWWKKFKTLKKECIYRNEKYKVVISKCIGQFIGLCYEVKIRKVNRLHSRSYYIEIIDNTYKTAVEEAFERYGKYLDNKNEEEKDIQEFNSWNGVIEQCST